MSDLPPKADIDRRDGHVRLVPILLQKSAIKEQGKRRIFLEPSVAIRSIESGEDAVILATAAVIQHTTHRLVVVEQPVWRAAGGSVR
jgi:hypothetical protein